MAQATTRHTEMTDYVRQMHRVADNLPHEIDRIQMRRAIAGLKKELDVEYDMGEKRCPVRKRRLKKAIDDVKELVKAIRVRNEPMKIVLSLEKARVNKSTVIWVHPADDLSKGGRGVEEGFQRKKHLYIERRGSPGNYRYIYYDPDKKDYYHTGTPQHPAGTKGVGLQSHQEKVSGQQPQEQKPAKKTPPPKGTAPKVAGAQMPEVAPAGATQQQPLAREPVRAKHETGGAKGEASLKDVQNYVKEFREAKDKFPMKFSELVDKKLEDTADQLILHEKSKAYNITRYSVYHNTDLQPLLGKQKQLAVTMYNAHPVYSEGLLMAVRKKVGDVPYAVSERASKFEWDNSWTREPEVEYMQGVGGKWYAKATEHNVIFEPTDDAQAQKVADVVKEYHGKEGAKEGQKTKHPATSYKEQVGWGVPDNRTNIPLKGYQKVFLNYSEVKDKVITVMTKGAKLPVGEEVFRTYRAQPIYCNPEVAEYLAEIKKSLALILDLMKSNR